MRPEEYAAVAAKQHQTHAGVRAGPADLGRAQQDAGPDAGGVADRFASPAVHFGADRMLRCR
jgi:hypothetical protein